MTVKQFIKTIKTGESRASEISDFILNRNCSKLQVIEILEQYAITSYFEGIHRGKNFVIDIVIERSNKFNTTLRKLKEVKK